MDTEEKKETEVKEETKTESKSAAPKRASTSSRSSSSSRDSSRDNRDDRNDRSDRNDRDDRSQQRKPYKRFYRRRQKQMVPAYVDWKDVDYLERFVPERGKIMPRRISGVTAKDQRRIARAIKRARVMALLPYVGD